MRRAIKKRASDTAITMTEKNPTLANGAFGEPHTLACSGEGQHNVRYYGLYIPGKEKRIA